MFFRQILQSMLCYLKQYKFVFSKDLDGWESINRFSCDIIHTECGVHIQAQKAVYRSYQP